MTARLLDYNIVYIFRTNVEDVEIKQVSEEQTLWEQNLHQNLPVINKVLGPLKIHSVTNVDTTVKVMVTTLEHGAEEDFFGMKCKQLNYILHTEN